MSDGRLNSSRAQALKSKAIKFLLIALLVALGYFLGEFVVLASLKPVSIKNCESLELVLSRLNRHQSVSMISVGSVCSSNISVDRDRVYALKVVQIVRVEDSDVVDEVTIEVERGLVYSVSRFDSESSSMASDKYYFTTLRKRLEPPGILSKLWE